MKTLLILFVIFGAGTAYVAKNGRASGPCSISINAKGLGEPHPLILKENLNQKFPFFNPTNPKGDVPFTAGQKIHLSCAGSKNSFNTSGLQGTTDLIITCSHDNTFAYGNKEITFEKFTCQKYSDHIARRTGKTCAGQSSLLEIGIPVGNAFLRHIYLCFDETNAEILYTQFNMTAGIMGFQSQFPRPSSFIQGDFYKTVTKSLNALYNRNTERGTVGYILGSTQLGAKYIHSNDTYYLARGHLTAKVDFVYGSQQRLTFYYVNTAPQWQIINAGNWNTLEGNCRKFASDKKWDLQIYTGTHGVCSLPNSAGVDTALYLFAEGNKRKIPVPRFYWKVVYNNQNKKGVAFVTVNNPYQVNKTTDIFCTDVCNQIKWVTWHKEDIATGFSYCCTVDDFRKTVKTLPPFEVKGLLV